MPRVTILGNGRPQGAYLLRLAVEQDLRVRFGRYRRGAAIPLEAGEYCYVGSAMAKRGYPLASRLLRHATRSGGRAPHAVRAEMLACFRNRGWLGSVRQPAGEKRLHWHIDYLLDQESVDLAAVILVCSWRRREAELAGWLQARPETAAFAPGLGAGDARGRTHLLRVEAAEGWWLNLPRALERFVP